MDSLIYSLNVTTPIFLTMIIGYILGKKGILTESFNSAANKYIFKIALPALLFVDMASTSIRDNFDVRYVLFCAVMTTVMFFSIWIGARIFIKEKSVIGSFVQASYRSSAAILAVAFIRNIYGNAGMAPLMIIGCVPLFNIYAVAVLTVEGQNQEFTKNIKQALINIIKNPIIIAIVAGVAVSALDIKFGAVIDKTLNNLAVTATPIALLVTGAGFEGRKALSKIGLTVWATLIKLVIIPAVFIPAAVYMGFRNDALMTLIIMLASPTATISYIMAKNMNNDAPFAASVIVLTTFLSALTITFWVFLARYFGVV